MVGAVLVKGGRIIGRGWHRRAGQPHAEIEAIQDAVRRGNSPKGATLFVTLEPCSTHGRTPPCTEAVFAAGIRKVVAGATDPNPSHGGKGFAILKRAGLKLETGVLGEECERLNEAFNYWIVHRTPFVTVKAAMTLDGKIATATGESKWITGPAARAYGMKLRQGADAILVGINTVLADDPSLTVRVDSPKSKVQGHLLRRIVLDAQARTPLDAKVVNDGLAQTTIVVSQYAPKHRVAKLTSRVQVLVAPLSGHGRNGRSRGSKMAKSRFPAALDLKWLLRELGSQGVTSLLVEGGGEVNASFLLNRWAHRIAFFYAPIILGGRDSIRAVAGDGAQSMEEAPDLADPVWRKLGPDWLLTARLA
jgi:diaminohydroxyphosphoribosylaminopyrimidine deaminase/5-amino-6-(5-phosphoribosylamino)uracil reductase